MSDRTDACGWPEGTVHPHVEQCHRAERERVAAEIEALAEESREGARATINPVRLLEHSDLLRALAERLRGGSDE